MKISLHVPFYLVLISLFMASCRKEGCTDEKATNYSSEAKRDDGSCRYLSYTKEDTNVKGKAGIKFSGSIDESMTWENDSVYLISGLVYVSNESILTIQAGATIYADASVYSALVVERGSKLNLQGQSDLPIVFTSSADFPAAGDWGGIVLNGYASVNTGNGSDLGEGFGAFGGSSDTDNSGILKYIRIEYAGLNNTPALSLRGVGSGTTLDYIQTWHCSSDGIMIMGGTCAIKHTLAYACGDQGMEWNYGWRGKGSFWHVLQLPSYGQHGIIGANHPADAYLPPNSFPELNDIDISGTDTSMHTTGFRLYAGSKVLLSNIRINNFYNGIEINDDPTLSYVLTGEVFIDQCSILNSFSAILMNGTPDGSGGVIDPILLANAYSSNNVNNDGQAVISSWLIGTWYNPL